MSCQGEPNWPPQWKGPFGPQKPLPSGEVGILIRVNRGAGVVDAPHCIVVMEWNHQEYFGSLYFDDEEFMQSIVRLLQSQIGHPIAEIGSLEVPR
jgi:hypothetical protein